MTTILLFVAAFVFLLIFYIADPEAFSALLTALAAGAGVVFLIVGILKLFGLIP